MLGRTGCVEGDVVSGQITQTNCFTSVFEIDRPDGILVTSPTITSGGGWDVKSLICIHASSALSEADANAKLMSFLESLRVTS